MAINLHTVTGMGFAARRVLQDKVQPYRYTDLALLAGLNLSLLEARRIRPDLFICRNGIEVPQYEELTGDTIPIEMQFRQALLDGMVAYVLIQDEDDVQDARSSMFMERFHSTLLGQRPMPIPPGAGTPSPQAAAKR